MKSHHNVLCILKVNLNQVWNNYKPFLRFSEKFKTHITSILTDSSALKCSFNHVWQHMKCDIWSKQISQVNRDVWSVNITILCLFKIYNASYEISLHQFFPQNIFKYHFRHHHFHRRVLLNTIYHLRCGEMTLTKMFVTFRQNDVIL